MAECLNMESNTLNRDNKRRLLASQRSEITEHLIYEKLSHCTKDPHNREVLERISADELRHYKLWETHTTTEVKPSKLKVWIYYVIARVLGLTFGLRLMEKGESRAQVDYCKMVDFIPAAEDISKEEYEHEKQLLDLIDEERLKYTSEIVRGLNVALVELTGTIAGFTLAFKNAGIIAMAAIIAGVAMTLSVASTEYLATKTGEGVRSPLKAVIYGGIANLLTVLFLIFPYWVFTDIYYSLGFMAFNAIVVIAAFSFYISVAKEISFKIRFIEMTLISLGIAGLTFAIGILVRMYLHIEI
jgi:VIT1/CCC1 family predicted Fe2+/Mn2+ transporter